MTTFFEISVEEDLPGDQREEILAEFEEILGKRGLSLNASEAECDNLEMEEVVEEDK